MPLTTISPRRSLTSYAKVQTWVGRVIRNRRFQLQRPRVQQLRYLDVGCGRNPHENFINLDYLWHPAVDVCWDITTGLPFADGSMQAVFSEHCLEHFPLPQAQQNLSEIRRVLAPGGRVRIVIPDGELYLRTYHAQMSGHPLPQFPYQATEATAELWCPMMSVNRIFYQDRESLFGHRTIFDFRLLRLLLEKCGFVDVTRCDFRQSGDPQLAIDSPGRQVESLYVEATVPFPR